VQATHTCVRVCVYTRPCAPADKCLCVRVCIAGNMQMSQYFVKVVPTDFVYLNGTVLKTNQFSYTENTQDMAARPGSLPGAPLP
jgi:hypothetical protein